MVQQIIIKNNIMNKINSFLKAPLMTLAIVAFIGYPLANVFAVEYEAGPVVADTQTTEAPTKPDTDGTSNTAAPVNPDTNTGPVKPDVDDAQNTREIVDDTITPADTNTNDGNNGGNGGRSGGRSNNNSGQVLGAEDFQFLNDLREGSSHTDVMELQKRLRAEGYFMYPENTGYFGPFTKLAVVMYQMAHYAEIGYVTGFFGPLTRAVING